MTRLWEPVRAVLGESLKATSAQPDLRSVSAFISHRSDAYTPPTHRNLVLRELYVLVRSTFKASRDAYVAGRDLNINLAGPNRPAAPMMLPQQTATFVGRGNEMSAIRETILPKDSPGNICLITGLPGVGKTELAIHADTILKTILPMGSSMPIYKVSRQECHRETQGPY